MGASAIVDVIDRGDQFLYRQVYDGVSGYGSTIIGIPPMSNGVGFMISRVIDSLGADQRGTLGVLRIWGHGRTDEPRVYVSYGPPALVTYPPLSSEDNWAAISPANLPQLRGTLMQLTSYFANSARVELRACVIAKFEAGKTMLQDLAKLWNVRVQAPEKLQSSELWTPPVWEATPDGKIRQLGNNEVIEVAARR